LRQPQDPATVAGPVVAVVDSMGGGIGAQIVAQLRQELPPEIEILALGTNTIATQKMMQARASRRGSSENAVRMSIGAADVILAPVGVVVPNSMMGESSPAIAEAVAGAPGRKLLLPINQPCSNGSDLSARCSDGEPGDTHYSRKKTMTITALPAVPANTLQPRLPATRRAGTPS
jgi:hypothetical protein